MAVGRDPVGIGTSVTASALSMEKYTGLCGLLGAKRRCLRTVGFAYGIVELDGSTPPLYGLVLGSLEQLVPIPLVFILTSVFFSCLAVYWVGRVAGPLGALVWPRVPFR